MVIRETFKLQASSFKRAVMVIRAAEVQTLLKALNMKEDRFEMLSESRERWFQLVHLYDATWIRAKHLTHRALSRFRRQRRRTRREGKGKVTYGDRSYESK